MKKSQVLGFTLVLLGFLLLFKVVAIPEKFATVIIDETPPEWIIGQDGNLGIFPRNGINYQDVSSIQCGVTDLESGVASVSATLDGVKYTLNLVMGWQYSGWWRVNIPPLAEGAHTITLTATNQVGLSITYSGAFAVLKTLTGKWYVNNIEVTEPNQVLKFTTLTLSFKFIKVPTEPEPFMVCTVEYAGPQQGAMMLNKTAENTWVATKTLNGGVYAVTLKATDGATIVQFTLFEVNVGSLTPDLSISQWIGVLLIIPGAFLIIKPKIPKIKKR